ncbi:NAD(P)-dependent oxidoreductase [Thermasporomyces composti]|uniref:3-hydroxyisobutyrate dehydrogenase n=1 Tax=Thermasporomyces composti TaxID=696763 RepID=A0A3D9V798_THECX|nr:NAD(P)-dependent oxidoreductase [Thermasporomyces composti]REF37377.1 3-hydroxyisobutyrate dehydrogenase [Thermasporomyces composti]
MAETSTTVAFLGLGAMGSRMARRLLDAGYRLVVWNRTPDKARDLVNLGAEQASSPADAARRADVVVTMVADPDALAAVTEGADGLAAGIAEGATVIEMSTMGPAAIERLAATVPSSVGVLDAPVLGSLSEAEAGELRVFVGGPDDLVARWTPLLSVFGSVHHVGPRGAGASAKLVANETLLGVLGVLGEAVALARGLGLSTQTTLEVLATTPLAAQAERRRPVIEGHEVPRRFALSLAVKDADLMLAAARAKGVDLRLVAGARSWLADAVAAGLGDKDYSTVIAHIAGQADQR